jgi:hypothetical protein
VTKSERFGLVLSPTEKAALRRLAERERIPAAAVVRRLIWREAKKLNIVDQHAQIKQEARGV